MSPFDKSWEKVYRQTNFGGGYPDLHLVRFMARNLYSRERRATRVLEVGCGVGANLWYLVKEGFDVYGLDGSQTAIQKCQKRLETMGLSCHLSVQDAASLDFPDNYFDAVVDVESIYANTFVDIKKILREVHRVLKNDGFFFSLMFGRRTDGYGLGKEIEPNTFLEINNRIFGGRGMAHFFSQEEIEKLLEENGFKKWETNFHHRTENYQKQFIEEWIVQARK